MSGKALRGSCLCGALRSEVTGPLQGTLDDDPGVRPAMHVGVGSKAPWHGITDDLPQHDALPPGP